MRLLGFIQIVQTSSGQQIIATSQPPSSASAGQRVQTFINGPGLVSAAGTVVNVASTTATATATSTVLAGSIPSTTAGSVIRPTTATTVQLPTSSGVASTVKPVVRVSPLATTSTSTTGLSLLYILYSY